jgi:hypothetical protein
MNVHKKPCIEIKSNPRTKVRQCDVQRSVEVIEGVLILGKQ